MERERDEDYRREVDNQDADEEIDPSTEQILPREAASPATTPIIS